MFDVIFSESSLRSTGHTKPFLIVFALFLLVVNSYSQQRITVIGRDNANSSQLYTIKGKVINFEDGEFVPDATVIIERQNLGTSTDFDGEFEFQLYKGVYTIKVSSVGFVSKSRTYSIQGNGSIRMVLEPENLQLSEVVVTGESTHDALVQKAGTEILSLESIKKLPPLAGEVDIIKSLSLLSGVATQGEVSNNFSVRGGGGDQNLFLFNGATIYNPSHMLGFFSSINSNVISQVEFFKGTVPARFGGRGSSVIDIKSKRGNFREFGGLANFGVVSSNLSLYTPVVKNKLALYAAGRYAYPRWLIRQAGDPNVRESSASFWDGNMIMNYIINDDNDLEFSYYKSDDEFEFSNNVSNQWINEAATLGWNSAITSKLTSKLKLINSNYTSVLSEGTEINRTQLTTKLNHLEGTLGFTYEQNDNVTFRAGGVYRYLTNDRGDYIVFQQNQESERITIDSEEAVEASLYSEVDLSVSDILGLSMGLRYSSFSLKGGNTFNEYDPSFSRSLATSVGSYETSESENVINYSNFEPRFTVRFNNSIASLNLGVSRNIQYLHLISNSTTSAPNDIWKFSDPYLKPQSVWQYSVGLSRNLSNNMFALKVDAYYKDLENLVEYKDGADLLVNESLETEVFNIIGEAYGIEVSLEKNIGKLKGNFNYTYSRSLRVSQSPFISEQINQGKIYPANLDVPHVGKFVGNYKIGPSATLNAVFTYSSGRLFTSPLGKFEYENTDFPLFVDRNNERTTDIHRLDLSIRFKLGGTSKAGQGHIIFAVYNVYGHDNAFSAFFQDFPGSSPGLYQLTIIDSPFPSMSYEFEF